MKKYDYSVIDFSEIENITTDYAKIKKSADRMKELGLLMPNGEVYEQAIKSTARVICTSFFGKLKRRIRYVEGGISEIFLNYSMMVERNDILAAYFYIAFLYGFMQWSVPEAVSLLPADDNALKLFVSEFGKRFSAYIEDMMENPIKEGGGEENE